MSYIGRGLYQTGGQYRKLDDISSGFNGSTTSFSLTVSNKNETPSVQNLMISINGVVQEPGSAFTVNGSTIHFTEAPETNSSFFGIVMGEAAYIAHNTVGANEMGVSEGAVSASGGVVVDSSKNISGFNKVTSTSFSGIFEGALSSSAQLSADIVSGSAQLATRISGSFTDASSSFSTRVTRNEATGSSLTNDSSSFSTRVTRNEASASSLTSASSSFSTRVSNLKSDSGSFSTRVTAVTSSISALKTDSGSFSTRVDNSEASGALMNQDLKTSASPTFVNVTATGTMTAQEFHTEFVSASIVYRSGSTKFGDSIDDIHSFSGSIHQSGSFNLNDGNLVVADNIIIGQGKKIQETDGNGYISFDSGYHITGSSAGDIVFDIDNNANETDSILRITANNQATELMRVVESGNVGIGNTAPPKPLTVEGDISASGDLTVASELFITNRGSAGTPAIRFGGDGSSGIYSGGSAEFGYAHGGSQKFLVDNSGDGTFAGSIESTGANAKISGSSTSTGSFGHVTVDGVLKTGDIELENERGHWRIIEEEEYLSIYNVKSNKKFKFVLEEIE